MSRQSMAGVVQETSEQEWQARVDLAAAYRLVAHYGWDDLIFILICRPACPARNTTFL